MNRLTHADIESLRRQRGRSLELYLTDKCPVGCAHCSVSALAKNPNPDLQLLEKLVDGILRLNTLKEVAISGGDPVASKQALQLAVGKLSKRTDIVLYTSGFWAKTGVATWISTLLKDVTTVYLSSDQWHSERIDWKTFNSAVEAIVASGSWLVLQVIDEPRSTEPMLQAIEDGLGKDWHRYAELSYTKLLPYGRAEGANRTPSRSKTEFGACGLLYTPVVRYDGWVTACCNEEVISGSRNNALRWRAQSSDEVVRAVREIEQDPLLEIMRSPLAGMRSLLAEHDSSRENYSSICDLCEDMTTRRTNGVLTLTTKELQLASACSKVNR